MSRETFWAVTKKDWTQATASELKTINEREPPMSDDEKAITYTADDSAMKFSVGEPDTGHLSFNVAGGNCVMRFEANGDIYIRGKLTTNDLEVVEGFKAWLAEAKQGVGPAT